MDRILYQIFEIFLEYILEKITNHSIKKKKKKKKKKKIENSITFKTKIGYYIELLMTETMKFLGSTKTKINKDENGGNTHHLEITKVALIYYNIVNNNYQHNSKVLYTSVNSC